jgi:hypothetical protein
LEAGDFSLGCLFSGVFLQRPPSEYQSRLNVLVGWLAQQPLAGAVLWARDIKAATGIAAGIAESNGRYWLSRLGAIAGHRQHGDGSQRRMRFEAQIQACEH